MTHAFFEIMFTPQVKAAQARLGSRGAYERLETPEAQAPAMLGPDEAAFIAARDSFYMASVSETGWPYVQHRGGPPGFLSAIDERTLAFPDFRGNRQYVSVGNLRGDGRVSLILVDYPNRLRLKILGRARLIEAAEDPGMMATLQPKESRTRVERAMIIDIAAHDWNCPQHLTPRHSEGEVGAFIAPLRARIAELEAAYSSTLQKEPNP